MLKKLGKSDPVVGSWGYRN